MFPSSAGDNSSNDPDNAPSQKWKGIFVSSLQKVQRQVHPSLVAREDAMEYVEELILRLMNMLCSTQPHVVQEVEERVKKTFPEPIDEWAIRDAQAALEKPLKGKKKSQLVLPVEKIHSLLVKEVLSYKIESQVSMYIVAVLEYIAADILKLTGNYVKNIKHNEISCQDIRVAMCADKVLMDMFFEGEEVSVNVEDEPVHRQSLTYESIVKDFILEEAQYIRDLNMIIKVFRKPFAMLFPRSKDLEVIFSSILGVHECTVNLLSSVEDQVEATGEKDFPYIGACFMDMIEAQEFDVYEMYVEEIVKPNGRERINVLAKRKDFNEYVQKSFGQGFKEAVKYVLPKLLLGPIYHCLHYFELLKVLMETSPDEEDKEFLSQTCGVLLKLKSSLEKEFSGNLPKRRPWETTLRLQSRTGHRAAIAKMTELQKSIDGWEGKDIWQSCSEYIMEGVLMKHTGRRSVERHVFLFDSLIILCKPNLRRSSVTGPVAEFKLKEKYQVRKLYTTDREDQDDVKHAFELQIRDNPNVVLFAKTAEEKCNWMAALISLQTRSMLERTLDTVLKEEERQQPMRLPLHEQYRFAVEDSDENIVFEDNQDVSIESPLIKGGIIIKLVERLTYHMYADPKFVKTFLTTYRSFCSPQELLDLLSERFDIPDPPPLTNGLEQGDAATSARDDLKRFRQEYVKPVQFRVVNVLRQWVDQHFYDFERDKSLLEKLNDFLTTVKPKTMKKWSESITKVIQRRVESPSPEIAFTYLTPIPGIEWHLANTRDQFDLMTLHPIEIARQVTLLEFDLYRAVKPSELVGSVWISKDKSKCSPNLLKMIHFSTMFTFWMERCIVEAENLDERVAVMNRVLEIMLIFQELNNFNGVLEVVSALNSAPVYRLEHSFHKVPNKLMKAFDEAKELNSDHFKKYKEKLRSINPPCVPFLGMYLTNILKTEEGNPDFLQNRPDGLINFSKRRKVAEITGEIQQYQNQPYCLKLESEIRSFLEALNPMEQMPEKEFNDFLYKASLDIEPRGMKQAPKFPRHREYSLESPGIRPTPNRHKTPRDHHHQVSESKSFNYQRISEEDSDPSSSRDATPTTPLTPTESNSSVFTNAILSPGALSSQTNLLDSTLSPGGTEVQQLSHLDPPLEPLKPPPRMPQVVQPTAPPRPRRQKEGSLSETSSCSPRIPPRDHVVDQPPPVPPRKDSIPGTLPRAHSMSVPLRQMPTLHSATLPRRNSERDTPMAPMLNGENFAIPELPPKTVQSHCIPELPPKTYKHHQHSRKQSS